MTKPYFTKLSQELISHLDHAEQEILVAVAWFTNPVLFSMLKNKLRAGVRVEVMISDDAHNFGKLPFSELQQLGGSVWIKAMDDSSLMHHKFCVIDNKRSPVVLTGSYNWSVKAEKNLENLVAIDDPDVVERYHRYFATVLKHSGYKSYSAQLMGTLRKDLTWEAQEDNRLFLLEQSFNREAHQNIQTALRNGVDLDTDLIYSMMQRYSPVGAAKMLATSSDGEKIQGGLKQLWKKNLLPLSFERLILKKQYAELFSAKVKDLAEKKLASLNFHPSKEGN